MIHVAKLTLHLCRPWPVTTSPNDAFDLLRSTQIDEWAALSCPDLVQYTMDW